MRFNTHNRTPKIVTNKPLKIMLALCYGLAAAFFLFLAIACSITIHNILPAVLIIVPIFVPAGILVITLEDILLPVPSILLALLAEGLTLCFMQSIRFRANRCLLRFYSILCATSLTKQKESYPC